MLMLKVGMKSVAKRKWETLAISLMIAFSLALFVSAGVVRGTLLPLFSNYLRSCYGDVIVLGYIPYYADKLFVNASWVKDFTGYAVVPSYGVYQNKTYPLLLGFTEAAYRNNTLLGGFKAPPLKPGEAVLLRQGSSFLRPGMSMTIYPMITIEPVKPFKEKIVGYAEGGLPLPAGPVVFLNKADGEKLVRDFGGYTVYSVILKHRMPEREAVEKVTKLLKEAGAFVALVFYTKKDLLFYPGEDVILESTNALKFLSTTSWAVATAIIVIISILYIERNVREIASLRSLGASSWNMAQYLLGLWGSRALLGLVLALLIGYAVAISSINAALSHPRLQPLKLFVHVRIDPSDLAYACGMALLTAILSVTVSLIAISKMNVVEAMRFYGLKIRLKMESSLPFNMMIAVSDVRSTLWRSFAALVLISLSLSLVAVPIILRDSILHVNYPKSFDVSVTFLRIPHISPPVSFVIDQLKGVKGAKSMSVWVENLYGSVNFKLFAHVHGKEIPLYGSSCWEVLKGSCWDVTGKLLEGSWPSGREVALSNLAARLLHVKVGDKLKITVESDNFMKTYTVKVSGIFADPVYPPKVILSKTLLPKRTYNVMVVYALAKDENVLAKKLQGILIGNAYAAASITWQSMYSELKNNLNYVAESISLSALFSFSVILLALLTFSFSETVIKEKFLALLKGLGSTSKDYFVTSWTKWIIIAVPATVLTLTMSLLISESGVSYLSRVYLLPSPSPGIWTFCAPLFATPFLALIDVMWFKRVRIAEKVKES